jgi:hypothetical protein
MISDVGYALNSLAHLALLLLLFTVTFVGVGIRRDIRLVD